MKLFSKQNQMSSISTNIAFILNVFSELEQNGEKKQNSLVEHTFSICSGTVTYSCCVDAEIS